ncbi:MAG TPA: hypothetical protein VL523_05475 [Terriglobia bacterium]|nr:hypothetical protein [Terriglobia bacterium]
MRVFVLGAGASVHAGYPLTNDLGPKLVKWASENAAQPNVPWIDTSSLLGHGSLGDIEEIVTALEASKKDGGTLAGLREALCAYFDSIRPVEAELYGRLADSVGIGDTILSFNYDLSLELELRRRGKWQVRDGYGFEVGIPAIPRSPLKLLKLHGSTNWTDLPFGGARGTFLASGESLGDRPVFPWGFDHLGYPGVSDPRYVLGPLIRSGSLVLPSRKKEYFVRTSLSPREREGFWNSLWAQATEALRQAAEVTLIGYSVPAADERAQKLIFGCRNSTAAVTVCCKRDNRRLSDEFQRNGFENVRTDLLSFEDWLDTWNPVALTQRETCYVGGLA